MYSILFSIKKHKLKFSRNFIRLLRRKVYKKLKNIRSTKQTFDFNTFWQSLCFDNVQKFTRIDLMRLIVIFIIAIGQAALTTVSLHDLNFDEFFPLILYKVQIEGLCRSLYSIGVLISQSVFSMWYQVMC